MPAELRDFLNWFNGWAENIKARPSPAQWKRLKERVSELEARGSGADAQPRQPSAANGNAVPSIAKPKPPATSEAKAWRARVASELEGLGIESDDAVAMADDAIDDGRSPADVARQLKATM